MEQALMSNEIAVLQEQSAASLVEIRRDNIRFPRLHSYPAPLAMKMLSAVVLRAATLFDAQVSREDVQNIALDLYTELMADVEGLRTMNITIEEIHRAFRKAAMGQSVEYYGRFSFHFLYKCIIHYVKNEVLDANRQMLMLAQSKQVDSYAQKVALVTGTATRQMVEHSKFNQ